MGADRAIGRRSGRRGRCRRATSSFRRTRSGRCQRPAGRRRAASRAAGRQPAADRPRRRRAGSGATSRAWRRSSPRCSIRARRRRTPSRSPTTIDSIGGAHRHRRGHRPDLRQRGRDEGQLRHRAATCCPTWRGIPAFAPEEIERQRQQMLSGLQVSFEDPDYIANAVFDRLVYGFHPYGMPRLRHAGVDSQRSRATICVAFHKALVRRRTTPSSPSSAT